MSCWDLNQNFACDVGTEDRDADGACTPRDCFGTPTGTVGVSAGAIESFRVEYSGESDPWSSFTGGGLGQGQDELGRPVATPEDLVFSGQVANEVAVVTSDQFTTRALEGKVAAIAIEDLVIETSGTLPSSVSELRLTLVEHGDGGAFEWFETVATGGSDERNIDIQASSLQYLFSGCVPTSWRPGPDFPDRDGMLLPSSTLDVTCETVSFQQGVRQNLFEWLELVLEQLTTTGMLDNEALRELTVTYLLPDGSDGNALSYGGTFPVRYVFPRFDRRVSLPLSETVVIQASDFITVP